MAVTPATFRQHFPEFASVVSYPDPQVQFWIDVAGKLLPADRWADLIDDGTELFTAHHLAIGKRDQDAAAIGGTPGAINGPQTSKAVDKVSASYDTGAVTYEGAGFWNATMYGIGFWRLARMIGAGGIQL
ncbi:MAG: DUF4054 domain-containing protein [Hydrogenophaga sp.]|uniref:DUF4054 domain-containing protein n=1 Tax=Hydrogenophaga sp. TaxID=1904254 RepID=UPI0027337095|nr:DUF4054 domain-containing protein [Hydrogenophaga sp.]MDP3351819.1 DUF4054 domain-containing protein [Hydrogenophaga sp.]